MEWKKRRNFEEEHFSHIEKRFGRRLRVLRMKKGFTQEELAFRSGLNRNYISDTERGMRNISLLSMSKLAKGLEIEMIVLFDFENN